MPLPLVLFFRFNDINRQRKRIKKELIHEISGAEINLSFVVFPEGEFVSVQGTNPPSTSRTRG